MKFPFVSRARFEDKELRIRELQQEIKDLKYSHARVVDEINFRSTGFHIDERFVRAEEVLPASAPIAAREPSVGVSGAIEQFGPRMTAIRRGMEATNMISQQEEERKAAEVHEQKQQIEAARRMEEVLRGGGNAREKAAQA